MLLELRHWSSGVDKLSLQILEREGAFLTISAFDNLDLWPCRLENGVGFGRADAGCLPE